MVVSEEGLRDEQEEGREMVVMPDWVVKRNLKCSNGVMAGVVHCFNGTVGEEECID